MKIVRISIMLLALALVVYNATKLISTNLWKVIVKLQLLVFWQLPVLF